MAVYFSAIINYSQVCFPAENCSLCQAIVAFVPLGPLEPQNVVLFMKCILPFTTSSGKSHHVPLHFSRYPSQQVLVAL